MGITLEQIILYTFIGCAAFGLLIGLIKGAGKGFIRACCVIGSLVASFFLKTMATDFVCYRLLYKGSSIKDLLLDKICTGELASAKDTIWPIIYIIIGIVCFILIMFALLIVAWILSGILGLIFVHGKKKNRLLGAVFGLVSGLAFGVVLTNVVTGLSATVQTVGEVEVEGQTLIQKLGVEKQYKQVGIEEYNQSQYASYLKKLDNYIFNKMSSAELEVEGEKKTYTLTGQVDGLKAALKIAAQLQNLSNVDFSGELNAESKEELVNLLNNLADINADLADSEEAKEMLNNVVDVVAEAFELTIEDFDITELNFSAAADLVEEVYGITSGESSEVDINNIVHLANESNIADVLVAAGAELNVDDSTKNEIASAIASGYTDPNTGETVAYDAETQETLKKLFGIE